MGVLGDLDVDFESECERGAAGCGGDARCTTRTDGREEVFDLEAQRFGARGVQLGEGEAA